MDSPARLVAALGEAADLLRSHAVEHWPERLESHAERVRLADPEAFTGLRAEFGGMGSFNDVWIDPRNGHRVAVDQVQPVNQHLDQLRAEIYELTDRQDQVWEPRAFLWVLTLSALEVLVLFLLFSIETPLTPFIHDLAGRADRLVLFVTLLTLLLGFLLACLYQLVIKLQKTRSGHR